MIYYIMLLEVVFSIYRGTMAESKPYDTCEKYTFSLPIERQHLIKGELYC